MYIFSLALTSVFPYSIWLQKRGWSICQPDKAMEAGIFRHNSGCVLAGVFGH